MPFIRLLCTAALMAVLLVPLDAAAAQSPGPSTTGTQPSQTATPQPTATPWRYYLASVVRQRSSAPLYTTSLYVDSADPVKLYDAGCGLGLRDAGIPGRQDSLVVLDFGQGWREEVDEGEFEFGVWMFTPVWRFVSTAEVADLATHFAAGYWDCSGQNDQESLLTLAVGTSNYASYAEPRTDDASIRAERAAQHGRAWAQMITALAERLQPYARQIIIIAANDIEPAWNKPEVAFAWAQAYDSNNPRRIPYYNYGSCDGCPSDPSPTWRHSSTGWSQGDVYTVSWAIGTAFPLPEIYGNTGVHARQWQAVSQWGAQYHASRQAMQFAGVMTQMQACQQVNDASCETLDNTPEEGWQQMYTELFSSPYTYQDSLRWSTDIRWLVPR